MRIARTDVSPKEPATLPKKRSVKVGRRNSVKFHEGKRRCRRHGINATLHGGTDPTT